MEFDERGNGRNQGTVRILLGRGTSAPDRRWETDLGWDGPGRTSTWWSDYHQGLRWPSRERR